IAGCWNALRDPKAAVKNTINLGKIGSTACRTMIVTGPNGKGKTENTVAAMYATIMAQTLCVAPGSLMFVKPINQFISHIKNETNISRDRSLLMSVAQRMGTVLEKIKKADGFTLVVLDEPCGGSTKEKLARSAANVYIQKIGQNPKILCLTTTHF